MQSLSPAVQKNFRDDLVAANAPSFLSSDSDILPVRNVGAGIPRNNAQQAVKSYLVLKAAAATTQTQVATVTANTRIFFLGAQLCSTESGDEAIIEDAATGALSPSDNSTISLYYANSNETNVRLYMGMAPRECKSGIRVQVTKTGTETTRLIVWYLEERTDGQLISL